ncbi:MAG: SBBP repeat-containing protein, partial [Verrucomicrobiota bacterium]
MKFSPFRYCILIPFLLVFALALQSPATEMGVQEPAGYSSRIDGVGDEIVYDSATDGAGNVYVVGRFNSREAVVEVFRDNVSDTTGRPVSSTQDVMITTRQNPASLTTTPDLFVIKYDRDGNVVWKRVAGSGAATVATGVAVDPAGNVFITGSFSQTATFGSVTISCGARANTGNFITDSILVDSNIFVAMLDRDGVWQWAKQFDFTLYPSSTTSDADRGEDVFAGSSIALRTDYGGGLLDRPPGTGLGHGILLDSEGNIYVKGTVDHIGVFTPQNSLTWLRSGNRKILVSARFLVGGVQREIRYQNNAFVAKLAAVPPTAGSSASATKSYTWSWVGAVSSNALKDPDTGAISNIDTGTAVNGIYYGNTTSTITGLALDNSNSLYITGDWKGNLVAGGPARISSALRDGYVARWRTTDLAPLSLATYTGDASGTARGGAIVVDENRNSFVTGSFTNTSNLSLRSADSTTLTHNLAVSGANNTKLFVAKISPASNWIWAESPTASAPVTATATALSRDAAGALYLGGRLSAGLGSTTIDFRSTGLPTFSVRATNGGGAAAFVAKLTERSATLRVWQWTLQTQDSNGGTGGPGFDTADLRAGLGGTLYWLLDSQGGHPFATYRSNIAADNAFDITSARGAFLLPLLTDAPALSPTFSVFNTAICGQEVLPPSGVFRDGNNRTLMPDIVLPGADNADGRGYFYWDTFEKKLFAVAPVVADIRWKVNNDPQSTAPPLTRRLATAWPTPAQGLITQVTGAGPNGDEPRVNLEPSTSTHTFGAILYQNNASQVVGAKQLATKTAGYAVLLYTQGQNSALGSAPVSLDVVRSYLWPDAAVGTTASAEIGQPLNGSAFGHSDPTGRNGYVVNLKSRYDGFGPGAAYDRATQLGSIIPVNTDEATPEDDLFVIWSSLSAKGTSWPSK